MGWLYGSFSFPPALSICPPSQDSVPSLAVCGLMRSRPSHPGGGGFGYCDRGCVCEEAGGGGQKAEKSAAPTRAGGGALRVVIRAPRGNWEGVG